MFIYTTKLSKKKIATWVVIIGLIVSMLILCWPKSTADDVLGEQLLHSEQTAITVGCIKTNEDRIIFLNQKGHEVSKQELSAKSVQIPTEFDSVYLRYNELQKSQGFDLEKFKGKTVMLYTYEVLNYENAVEEIHANILIYKNKIIGGDISSVKLDGFITGFDKT